MGIFVRALLASVLIASGVSATAQETTLDTILSDYAAIIQKGSRKTVQPAIDALANSGLADAQRVLRLWQAKEIWIRKSDDRFFLTATEDKKTYRLLDLVSGDIVGEAARKELKQLKPNSGVRALIAAALVRFQLSDPDPATRAAALETIKRKPAASQLAPLRASIEGESDPAILARKKRLERLLALRFESDTALRVAAIESLSTDLAVETRAALNSVLASSTKISANGIPEGNVARQLHVGKDLARDEALALLADAGLAPARVPPAEKKAALTAHAQNGTILSFAIADLDKEATRSAAYAALAAAGRVQANPSAAELDQALSAVGFYQVYDEVVPEITTAAREALSAIEARVLGFTLLDLTLDGLSLASIYFLAAIGLAITFGVMGVINMAHGEFIMIGAYTGYVVQLFITNYTLSLVVALPLAFAVGFLAGVVLERLVIRWLYDRPLETLLATFGVSIALQQIAKNVFGTQARPLTAPDWLDGALVINEVVAISWIRVAIFALGLSFLALLYIIMNHSRLGLEVRAVTQNPRMAASMGIDPDRIRMLTFGLGSGIAGIAGVAIGLFAKVTSGLGQDYIVQSFMTVVIGGVGNLFGALAGAGLVGALQKAIEWFNPSNTLAAQTYMIVFIIIFIQFRPKGIFALKGRAAGD